MGLKLAAALFCVTAGLAHAEGCAPVGGETVPEVEALNQLVVDSDFDGLSAKVGDYLGVNLGNAMLPIASVFKDGFTGCTTVAQRRDVGGLVQSMVVYHGAIGPLFGYWMSMTGPEGFALLTFEINTDLAVVTGYMK